MVKHNQSKTGNELAFALLNAWRCCFWSIMIEKVNKRPSGFMVLILMFIVVTLDHRVMWCVTFTLSIFNFFNHFPLVTPSRFHPPNPWGLFLSGIAFFLFFQKLDNSSLGSAVRDRVASMVMKPWRLRGATLSPWYLSLRHKHENKWNPLYEVKRKCQLFLLNHIWKITIYE